MHDDLRERHQRRAIARLQTAEQRVGRADQMLQALLAQAGAGVEHDDDVDRQIAQRSSLRSVCATPLSVSSKSFAVRPGTGRSSSVTSTSMRTPAARVRNVGVACWRLRRAAACDCAPRPRTTRDDDSTRASAAATELHDRAFQRARAGLDERTEAPALTEVVGPPRIDARPRSPASRTSGCNASARPARSPRAS